MRLNDRVFGMFMLILAVVYGLEATKFPEPFGGSESVGPETFPIILSFFFLNSWSIIFEALLYVPIIFLHISLEIFLLIIEHFL